MFIRSSIPATIGLVVALATAGACKGKTADCAAVGNKVVALIRAELEREQDGDAKRRRESMLPALKEELESKCKAEKWSEVARSCVDRAKSIAELEKCDPDRGFDKSKPNEPDKPVDAPRDPDADDGEPATTDAAQPDEPPADNE